MRMKFLLHTLLLLSFTSLLQAQVDFKWDVDTGCVPYRVVFYIDSASIDVSTVTSAEWEFGNDSTASETSAEPVSTTFIESKIYTIRLSVNGGNDISKFYAGALPEINSNFEAIELDEEPEYTYSFVPEIDITTSDANYSFAWEHWDGDDQLKRIVYFADRTNPDNAVDQYQYADTGIYRVHLTVREMTPGYTCESTTIIDLAIFEEFLVPNVFAPEGTDYFIVDPEDDMVVLSFKVFSRTGLKVFEQESPIIYWDGANNSGQEMGTGVYFYVIEATQGDTDGYYTKTGFIHLYR